MIGSSKIQGDKLKLQVLVLKSCFKGQKMDLRKILLERGIFGSFFLWLLTSSSQLVIKKSSYVEKLRDRGQGPEKKGTTNSML